MKHHWITGAILMASLACGSASAELQPEDGGVEALPSELPPHWFIVQDGGASQIDARLVLFDGDSGEMKGMLATGYWTPAPAITNDRKTIIVAERYFPRGTRGKREDLAVLYNAETLLVDAEIPIPPKSMTALTMQHMTALTGNQRYFAVTNFTPMQSVSLVDLEKGELLEEVDTPGCGQTYPAGDNRIMTLCGDGSLLTLTITADDGSEPVITRSLSKPFFDPDTDPVTIPAARKGDTWFFTTLNGNVLEVDASSDTPVLNETWSLLSKKEKKKEWRTSGYQSADLHQATGLYFTLMHQGGEETYEEPGEEVWVFDTDTRKRLRRIELENVALAIAVSRDDEPLLFAAGFKTRVPMWMMYILGATGGLGDIFGLLEPVVDVYDARTGKHLRTVKGVAHFPSGLMVP